MHTAKPNEVKTNDMAASPIDNAAAEAGDKPSTPADALSLTAKGEVTHFPASQSIDPVTERRLVWKFDLRILPLLALMYLFNSLDKSNMGNAKTAGLVDDLGLKGNQYNILLSVRQTESGVGGNG